MSPLSTDRLMLHQGHAPHGNCWMWLGEEGGEGEEEEEKEEGEERREREEAKNAYMS